MVCSFWGVCLEWFIYMQNLNYSSLKLTLYVIIGQLNIVYNRWFHCIVKYTNINMFQDGIMSARSETQLEIQLAAHHIYESLISGSIDTYKAETVQQGILPISLMSSFINSQNNFHEISFCSTFIKVLLLQHSCCNCD